MQIKKVTNNDHDWLKKVAKDEWGGEFCVFLGKKFYIHELDGFYSEDEAGKKLGFITYEIQDHFCEIMNLSAFKKFQGIGTALLEKVIQEAKSQKCKKIIVRTTNDNLDALRFYQKKGFVISKIYKNALDADRKIKPSIPKIGDYGIEMRDCIELECQIVES